MTKNKIKKTTSTPRITISATSKKFIKRMAKFGLSEGEVANRVFKYFSKLSTTKTKQILNYGTKA